MLATNKYDDYDVDHDDDDDDDHHEDDDDHDEDDDEDDEAYDDDDDDDDDDDNRNPICPFGRSERRSSAQIGRFKCPHTRSSGAFADAEMPA